MSRPPAISPSEAVLRDVQWNSEPRALTRPGEAPKASPSTAPQPAGDAATAPQPSHAPSPEDRLREALEEGYRKGLEQGREAGQREGVEQGRKLGTEKGFAEGRKAGTEEVMRQAQAGQEAMAARIDRLDKLLATLPGQITEQVAARMQASEDDMVALCYTAICRVLGDKLVTREGVLQSVRLAIDQCCGSGSTQLGLLAVHVNPRDLEILKGDPGFATWLKQHGAGHIPWLPDERVQLGGCIVRSNQGSLDARLEITLANLRELLLRERSVADSGIAEAGGTRRPE